jgi:peptidoglycan/LPS O-acetylase OafA/YrhL
MDSKSYLPEKAGLDRIKGLDSIRFFLACWVAIGHIGLFPLFQGIDAASGLGWLLKGMYDASVNGPAAVILFFVISGFCIHFPYRHGDFPRLGRYYPRRYFRILAPLLTAISLYSLLKVHMPLLGRSILWSIVCEEIYYLIYPCLLFIRRKFGWRYILAVAFILSTIVAWTQPGSGDYPSYGWQGNWLLGLPCWLLGCVLAEKSDSLHQVVSTRAIWSWRMAVWLVSCVTLGLRFHASIGFPHTLNWFAVLAYFWLEREIAYFRIAQPHHSLEMAGRWSYSLYLIHVCGNVIFVRLPVANLGFTVNWLLQFGWVLGVSYVFYLIVEKPSHAFARWLGRPSKIQEIQPRIDRVAA